jgi:hypothetical protein
MYNRNETINVKMTREQLHIIRAAYSSWLDRQNNITDEFIDIENMLNEFYPAIKTIRKAAV